MLKKCKENKARSSLGFLFACLLILVLVAAGWWFWNHMTSPSPHLNFIVLTINGEPRKVLSGESVLLHPNDKVKISEISTSIPLNLNIRLVAENLDVNALRFEEMPIARLLPEQEAFNHYTFRIQVKHYNEDMGFMIWNIRPFAEDWLDKASRIIDDHLRLELLERGVALLPDQDKLVRRLLDEYKKQKKWEKAASLLEKMKGKKEDPNALKELLDIYGKTDHKEKTIQVLKDLLRIAPENVEARFRLAAAFEEKGSLDQAIREYETLVTKANEQDRLLIYKNLGYLYTETEKWKEAINCYQKAAELDQKDANIYYNLSFLYEKINNQEKSDFYLENAITIKSDDLAGTLKLARNLFERGEDEKAGVYVSQVLKKDADNLEALALMARLLEKTGDKNALKSVYGKMLALQDDNQTILYNLGVLEYETGDLEKSLSYLNRYIALQPGDAVAHGILFDIYKQRKNTEMALKQAHLIQAVAPGEIEPYLYIFDHLKDKSDFEKAIPLFEQGLKSNPDNTDLMACLITSYLRTDRESLAVEEMERLLEKTPENISPLLQNMFDDLSKKGLYSDIIRIMGKAAHVYPKNVILREFLTVAYLKTSNEKAAILEMEKILSLKPDDINLLLQWARLCEKNNDIKRAESAYKRVLDIAPNNEEASEAYLRLRLEGVGNK